METTVIAEVVKEIIHEVPVGAKIAIGVGLLLTAAVVHIVDHNYEVNFSFKPAH